MLKKTILGVLKNLKNEEKIELMNFLNEKEENKAPDNNETSTETNELKEEDSEVEEPNSVKEEIEENVSENKTEENVSEDKTEEEPKEEDKVDNGAVQTVEPLGNGLRIEDVVMKDELQERLSAMDAKLDALIKENEDLRNQNSSLLEKYENKDFGTTIKKGMPERGKSADYVSFEEYSKNFM